jgi:hypothetical protein
MAVGKPLNRGSHYGSEVPSSTINTPEPVEIQIGQQEEAYETQNLNNEMSAVAPVPEYVPQEIVEEMNQDADTQEPDNNEDDVEAVAAPEVQSVKKNKETPAGIRIRELKEANRRMEKEAAEKERLMQMQMLQMQQYQQMQQQMQQQKQVEQVEEVEEDFNLNLEDDALIEAKEMKKANERMKAMQRQIKAMEATTRQNQIEARMIADENRLLTTYPDFYNVFTKENLAVLEKLEPELAETILANKNFYSQRVTAYKSIKQHGIDREHVVEADRLRAITNANKPRPMTSIRPQQGGSPLEVASSYANGGRDSESDRARALREMSNARKNMQ